MNRASLAKELKQAGVSLNGWMPVLRCDTCQRWWEPFAVRSGPAAPTARLDYWKCPNGCNAAAEVDAAARTVTPRHLVINGIPGMIFGDDDLPEFERYARSMDATEVPDKAI